MKLLQEGGRVKSSSIGYSSIYPELSLDFQQIVKTILKGRNVDINTSFFPKIGGELRTSLNRQPLRPIISTHQGMPGNFYPFTFEDKIDKIIKGEFESEHFEAMLEPRYSDIVNKQQSEDFIKYMSENKLKEAYKVLSSINDNDRASEKGRSPFFICRPSSTEKPLSLPISVIPQIENEVNDIFGKIFDCAGYLESLAKKGKTFTKNDIITYLINYNNHEYITPNYFSDSVAYFQADTFINLKGEVSVEGLQVPDVGFFLKKMSDKGSLKDIKGINANLRESVVEKIIEFGFSNITFVTRDNVLKNNEDLLEINEIEVLKDDFEKKGITTKVTSTNNIDFDEKSLYILMNIDYTNIIEINDLLNLAISNPNNFSPNPFVQFVSKYVTGFKRILLTDKNDTSILQKVVSPRHNKVNQDTLLKIEEYFNRLGLDSKKRIINIKKASSEEVLYVSRDSLYSMRKIAHFIEGEKYIEIIEVPFVDGEQIISKKGNDLLHMFRFMFTS